MIEGGWVYVCAAYGVALGGLSALALLVSLRARHWAKRAKMLEGK